MWIKDYIYSIYTHKKPVYKYNYNNNGDDDDNNNKYNHNHEYKVARKNVQETWALAYHH